MNKKGMQVSDSGKGIENIKIKKYKKGVKPGGKRAYEESKSGLKISQKGKLAKEEYVIDRGTRKKKHKVWEKDKSGDWILVHNEDKNF